MKHKLMGFTGAALLLALITSCQMKVDADVTGVDNNQIREQIMEMENTYAEAFNNRDADGILAYYAEDAESYSDGKAPMIGKIALKEQAVEMLANIPSGSKMRFTPKDYLISDNGQQVVEVGKYIFTDSTDAKIEAGNFIAVFEKRGDKYLCIREMVTAGPSAN